MIDKSMFDSQSKINLGEPNYRIRGNTIRADLEKMLFNLYMCYTQNLFSQQTQTCIGYTHVQGNYRAQLKMKDIYHSAMVIYSQNSD